MKREARVTKNIKNKLRTKNFQTALRCNSFKVRIIMSEMKIKMNRKESNKTIIAFPDRDAAFS